MKETSLSQENGLGLFRTYNYIPCDLEKESVSKTLEYAYDDWCMAQMAKALNKEDDYLYFMEASKNYKNIFDSTTGFMRAKLSDGTGKHLSPRLPRPTGMMITPKETHGNIRGSYHMTWRGLLRYTGKSRFRQ